MHIEKSYFTLPEIIDRWDITEADLIYLAENNKLRLSLRVFGVPIEFGDIEETQDGEPFRMPWERIRFSGLLDLHASDVFQLFRCGELPVSTFRTPHADYASVWSDAEPVLVLIGDLLLRRDERDRFEIASGFAKPVVPARPATFWHSPDYQQVRCHKDCYTLGLIQAEVVRALHAAALAGAPWQSGKAILSAAGSRSLKMSDVFKSQTRWRALILSNGRGSYRLNCD